LYPADLEVIEPPREYGIRDDTIDRWKSCYVRLVVFRLRRRKELEAANAWPMKMYAESSLGRDLLQKTIARDDMGCMSPRACSNSGSIAWGIGLPSAPPKIPKRLIESQRNICDWRGFYAFRVVAASSEEHM